MDKPAKAKAIERILFSMLLVALATGGYCYGRFGTEVPKWRLVCLIVAGYVVAGAVHRFALKFALKKLHD